MWACQSRVPLCPVMVKLYVYVWLVWIGHCVTYAGPSYHPVVLWRIPCLQQSNISKKKKLHLNYKIRTLCASLHKRERLNWLPCLKKITYQWMVTLFETWLTTLITTLSPSLATKWGPGNFPFTLRMLLVWHNLVTFRYSILQIKKKRQSIKIMSVQM